MKNYNTKQKKFLIAFFESNPDKCFTVEDICKSALDDGIRIGQTTVYRNLEALIREGIVLKRTMPEGNIAVFQSLLCETRKHDCHHLCCTDCGTVIHTDSNYIKKLLAYIGKENKFNCDIQRTIFYGLCEKCANVK